MKTILIKDLERANQKFYFRVLAVSIIVLLVSLSGCINKKQKLTGHVPAILSKLKPEGLLADTTTIDLVIGLPLRNQDSANNLLHTIYDPNSTNFHHYLSPEEYRNSFCPSVTDFQTLTDWVKSKDLKIVMAPTNRTFLHVRATAAIIQKVFGVTLYNYKHPTENRMFYSSDREPSIDLELPILHISGLDNYYLPGRFSHNLYKTKKDTSDIRYAQGSGSGGRYTGKDFRAAYVPDVSLTGTGQSVGILELNGYNLSDIHTYEMASGIGDVPIQNVYLDSYTGGATNEESAADIELVISMAPGISKAIVYGAPYTNMGVHDILNEMANPTQSEPLPFQISTSYYFFYDKNIYKALHQLALQGQSFFVASGDYGSYNETTGTYDFPPADNPYVTSVGGTELQTSGPGGTWLSETTWNWNNGTASGGGYSPWASGDPEFALPSWQSGMDLTLSNGSTTARNSPDVAMVADNILVYSGGNWAGFAGTSAAAPLWAGFMALANQEASIGGVPQIGFLNPILYIVGNETNYDSYFHDITTGNNFTCKFRLN